MQNPTAMRSLGMNSRAAQTYVTLYACLDSRSGDDSQKRGECSEAEKLHVEWLRGRGTRVG